MRIESNTSAVIYGNDYKPKNAAEAQEDLPELKKQLAAEEERLNSILKSFNSFGDSHKLITSTSGKGGHLDVTV
jgi:hypothetical protein